MTLQCVAKVGIFMMTLEICGLKQVNLEASWRVSVMIGIA